MLANYLIGLREGIEAALIISILVTYLVKLGEKRHLSKIFAGTVAAIVLSVAVGIALSELESVAPANIEPAISGITSLIAVGFVTWMIFWMAKQARAMSGNLRGQVDEAIAKSGWSLALVAFLSVIREGVETSVLLWTTAKTTGPSSSPVLGATLGLLTAAVVGYLMYRGSLKFNISKFFRFTGAFLVLVGAGILGYGIGELQEIGWLPLLSGHSYDVSAAIPTDGLLETILRGTLAFNNAPTVLQTIFWFGYILPTAWLFFRKQKTAKK
jgi:high-affinity iron transporter